MRILDSDTCIEILRGNARVITRREETADIVATTWITACELFYGAAKSKDTVAARARLIAFLATIPVLDQSPEAAQFFGNEKARLESEGRRLADADLMIGGIVLARRAILVTGNTKHYDRIDGLIFEDWIRG